MPSSSIISRALQATSSESKPDLVMTTVALAAVASLIYLTGLVIYRLYFHPLAKYPGPFLAKITSWHPFYYTWAGRNHEYLTSLHEKYGTFVRARPDVLFINDPDALKQTYGFKANVQKGKMYTVIPANPNNFSTHSAINKQQHARKRRMLAHCFSDAAIKRLEPSVIDCTTTFLQVLGDNNSYHLDYYKGQAPDHEKGWSRPFNIARVVNAYTFDVMGNVTFSKSYNMLTSAENIWVQDALIAAAKHKSLVGIQDWIYWSGIDNLVLRSLAAMRERYRVFAVNQLKERMTRGDQDDFFKYIAGAQDPETGEKFGMGEMGSESALMIVAGSDTSSTALSGAFYYLVRHPSTLVKLQKEIRETFNSVQDIRNGPILSSCKYLRAVLDESMRVSPPITGSLTREVLGEGITVAGQYLPAGVEVCVPHPTLMRNPKIYENPNAFLPERWLESYPGNSPEKLQAMRDAFCPFSIGPRGCIGRSLAYLELSIALASVVFMYDFRMLPGSTLGVGKDGTYDIVDVGVSKKDGPLVQFRRR